MEKKIVPVNYTLYLEWFKKIIKTIKSVSYSCWEGEVQLCEAFFASVTLSCSAPQFARSMSCCSGNKASYPLLQHCHLHHHIRPRCRARPVHKALTKCMGKLQLGYLQCKRFKLFVLPPVHTIVCIFEDEMEGRSGSSWLMSLKSASVLSSERCNKIACIPGLGVFIMYDLVWAKSFSCLHLGRKKIHYIYIKKKKNPSC